ncbi:threonine dehydrogenase-like Zn-dependent dehydrogenase [Variovorax boronicumulans]|jgi:threonine dehydrogenase-like Zn-dependent dehydrogenase|uniref:zinc-dependent alcohol dehydrogenase n=1 Tax=Variovorax TaxID=34072 RepID=UPI00278490BF|nr:MULTISPECIES: zinc-dependent alcohol dehydrogenase [Variovorax]MDQ0070366.1 threonine dehydrogenase-like Zn-dependent dehydrogenase [Variovorax boronicumulans]MDQ0607395.1 threonine dehydrogenase-like Zn-dependent dehydrogenase [Variovorax sp. W1I1]
MKALTYQSSKNVRVETVPDPILQEDEDIVLRVTATAICGSDLHIYRGKIPDMESGDILGHEFMGIVEDTGKAVTRVQKGDRVVVPFTIACGQCFFCAKALFAACETTNPGRGAILNKKNLRSGAGLFGYSHLYGGYPGGQAEYVRVPKANTGPLVIPPGLADEQVLFLSDILPTGYQAVVNGNVGPGSSVAIFGAGPVGLMAAASARLLGAERIFMVDEHPYRLAFAQATYGVDPINFRDIDDPAGAIVERTDFRGVDASIDAVGFEAKGSAVETVLTDLKLEGSSGKALRQAIAATRRGGVVSVPGVYAGFIHGFMFGDAFEKGLTFKMGQTHAQQHMPKLLEHIQAGQLKPEVIITHHMALEDAARGYEIFEKAEEECRKVVLTPSGPAQRIAAATPLP